MNVGVRDWTEAVFWGKGTKRPRRRYGATPIRKLPRIWVLVSENHLIRTAWQLLCRLFLALPHGSVISHLFLFQRFRVGFCPQANGIVVDIHCLMPLAVQFLRLGYHDLLNKLMDDLRRQLPSVGSPVWPSQ